MAATVFITGSTGFVGSYLAHELAHRGYRLRLLVRPTSHREALNQIPESQREWIEGDLSDPLMLRDLIQQSEYVVHAAAMVSFWKKDAKRLFAVNVEGTANVVNAALDSNIRKLLYVSSVAAVGRPPEGSIELDETAKWSDEDATHDYAKTKHLAELEVWRGVAEGLPAVILNPSLVLGRGDWNRSSLQVFRYIAEKNQFHPKGTVNYVDVRDVARMGAELLENEITGERYIQNAGATSYREFFHQTAEAMQRPDRSRPLPDWIAGLAWRWEALRSLLTQSPPKVTPQTLRSASQPHIYRSDKIRDTLRQDFRSLEETLQWVAEGYPKID